MDGSRLQDLAPSCPEPPVLKFCGTGAGYNSLVTPQHPCSADVQCYRALRHSDSSHKNIEKIQKNLNQSRKFRPSL